MILNLKKRAIRGTTFVVIFSMIATFITSDFAEGRIKKVRAPEEVLSFTSSQTFEKEVLNAYVEDDYTLKITYKTPSQADIFNLSLYRVGPNKGNLKLDIPVTSTDTIEGDGSHSYGFTYEFDLSEYDVPVGHYNLYLRRGFLNQLTGEYSYPSKGILYKNMEIAVNNSNVRILKYKDIIDYNRKIRKIGELYSPDRYLDNSLDDIKFVLRNPANNIYDTLDSGKIGYIKGISDQVVFGANTEYEKLLKIYEYTASHLFYDTIAFQTHSYQFANPYENIRHIEEKYTGPNASFGKVATTCQGFSAIFLALARAQGIPTRFVYGHRLAVPSQDWITESNISVLDHWWIESYVNGRWIFVDPTVGTTSKHNKYKGTWISKGVTNYTYFDPSEEQIATSHVYMNIYPDYRKHIYLTNQYEKDSISEFLEAFSQIDDSAFGHKSNGSLLNPNYMQADLKSWGDGRRSHFQLDGKGNVQQILWSDYGFTGNLSFTNFSHMTLFSSHHNKLEEVDLSANKRLKKVYLYRNKIKKLDLSSCPRLSYVRAQFNPMKELSIYCNGKNRFFTGGEHGSFYFTMDKKKGASGFSLYSRPEIGYKVKGIYDSSGQNLSKSKNYHFLPNSPGYSIEFELDPNSYRYRLSKQDNKTYKYKYIKALAQRLYQLGYYKWNPADEKVLYDDTLMESVLKFQVINDLEDTGVVRKLTWSRLFSDDAISMVSEEEYQRILANYLAEKDKKHYIAETFSRLELSAHTKYKNGKMYVYWDVLPPYATDDVTNHSNHQSDTNFEKSDSILGGSELTPMDSIYAIDSFQIYRSNHKDSGFYRIYQTKDGFSRRYINSKGVVKGKRYYYKVRGFVKLYGTTYYSQWSNVVGRKAK